MTLVEILHPSCALFLDFDGTMVDIAPQPQAVHVPAPLLDVLQKLLDHLRGAVAVISGRPIAQIDSFLEPLRLPVAGCTAQNAAIAKAACTCWTPIPWTTWNPLRVRWRRSTRACWWRSSAARWRCTTGSARTGGAVPGNDAAGGPSASPGLTLLRGKMVAEAKPGGASKGQAIEAFLAEPPFAGRTPVFIGDDITDEVGFSTVQRLGGTGIKVGDGATAAWQRLADPSALRRELEAAVAAVKTRTE